MSLRVIAKLDVKPPYVVKPVHFEGLRKVGTPSELAEKYYQQGADEIIYIDIVASLYQREIKFESIVESAGRLFVPFGVGGGVRTLDDFSELFHRGADKVLINTFVLQESKELLSKASSQFGSQSVVVNIEAKKWGEDNWECFTDCGRIQSGKDVVSWAREAESLGAGEIVLQSVDADGRKKGFDCELVKSVVEAVDIPVVAASGAGSLEDILEVVTKAKPSGVALASVLHYDTLTISDVKSYLKANGVEVSK